MAYMQQNGNVLELDTSKSTPLHVYPSPVSSSSATESMKTTPLARGSGSGLESEVSLHEQEQEPNAQAMDLRFPFTVGARWVREERNKLRF